MPGRPKQSMSNSTDPTFIASSISAAVAAILTIAQAVPNIDKRLSHVIDIERQIGRMPPLIRYVYVWPQYAYKIILIIVTIVGVLMVGVFMYSLMPGVALPLWLDALKGEGIWLVAIWLPDWRRYVYQFFFLDFAGAASHLSTDKVDIRGPSWQPRPFRTGAKGIYLA